VLLIPASYLGVPNTLYLILIFIVPIIFTSPCQWRPDFDLDGFKIDTIHLSKDENFGFNNDISNFYISPLPIITHRGPGVS
jgi:hypothetical protein